MKRLQSRWHRSRPPTTVFLSSVVLSTMLAVLPTAGGPALAADLLRSNPRLDAGWGSVEAATAADGFGGVFTALIDEQRWTVLVAVSHDDGRTYATVPVAEHPGGDVLVSDVRICSAGYWWMALDTDVYVAWREVRSSGTEGQVFVVVSNDRGASWSAPVPLATGPSRPLFDPSLACHRDGTALVAWADARDGREDIYVAGTRDRGATWNAPRRLDLGSLPGTTISRRPHVAIDPFDDDHAVVVWEETPAGQLATEVRANVTRDGGASWLPADVRVDPEEYPILTPDSLPKVVIGPSGTAWAAWIDDGTAVEMNVSADGGTSWPLPETASRLPGPITDLDAALALFSDAPSPQPEPTEWLRLLWQGTDPLGGTAAMYYNAATTTPSGGWRMLHPEELRVDHGTGPGDENRSPRLCSGDPDHVFAAYDGSRQGQACYNMLVGSLDGGRTWFDHEMYPGEGTPGIRPSAPGLACDVAGRGYLGWALEEPATGTRAEADACIAEDALHGDDPGIEADNPAIVTGGTGRVHAAWRAFVPDLADYRIHVSASRDDGAWWSRPPVVISAALADPLNEDEPALATAGPLRVYAAWVGAGRVRFSRSDDAGATWSTPVAVSGGEVPSGASNVRLCALDDGHVYVVWQDHRLDEDRIYFNRSLDFGATWEDEREMSAFTFDEHRDPQIACSDAGGVFIVFQRWRDWPRWEQVWLLPSGDFGANFGHLQISLEDHHARTPSVACDEQGNVFAAWVETTELTSPTYREVIARVSHDGGNTWEPQVKLDVTDPPEASEAREPTIVADDLGHVLVAWLDARVASSAWVNGSLDAGVSWFAADEPVDEPGSSPGDRGLAAGIAADGRAFVAWYDELPTARQPGGRLVVSTSRLFGTPATWDGPVTLDINRPEHVEAKTAAAMTRDGAAVVWRGEDPQQAGGLPYVNRRRILPGLVGEVIGLRWIDETTLRWRPIDLAETYDIHAATDPRGPWSAVDSAPSVTWSDTLPVPPPGTARFYLVGGRNLVGPGPLGH